ncbi:hypothetical protein G5I_07023 [Acromyrmex echinatior]|uniref:Uncharacterized protein n=1 Tax=Acromyrmex echinatior TaxID=103372 RepID=F4WMN9_ACREC|nr:hypothetical protein G5I_07023 [Acromyrmex echinatior]
MCLCFYKRTKSSFSLTCPSSKIHPQERPAFSRELSTLEKLDRWTGFVRYYEYSIISRHVSSQPDAVVQPIRPRATSDSSRNIFGHALARAEEAKGKRDSVEMGLWLRYMRRRSRGKYRDVTPCISRSLKRRYQLRTSRDPSPGDYINIPCPVARQALSCSEVTCDFTTKLQVYSRKIAALQNSLRIYRWHKVMNILENAKIRRYRKRDRERETSWFTPAKRKSVGAPVRNRENYENLSENQDYGIVG